MKFAICVTNDLTTDQRMQRITTVLQSISNCDAELIGRRKQSSKPIQSLPFATKRLNCFFERGFLFYLEYNIRLFIYLATTRPDIVYACDPDTLLAAFIFKKLFNRKSIYDSHEYFIETPELLNNRLKKYIWDKIESFCSSRSNLYITVNDHLRSILSERLGSSFHTIRNLPYKLSAQNSNWTKDNIILYQGVLNVGRGLEQAINAMDMLPNYTLVLAGDGDLKKELKALTQDKQNIQMLGALNPSELANWTSKARYGLNLLDNTSLNYYYSLANKFFDYMKYGVPSINMGFPVYKSYIDRYECGLLLSELSAESIADCINSLDTSPSLYNTLSDNALKAHQELNWEIESLKLIDLITIHLLNE